MKKYKTDILLNLVLLLIIVAFFVPLFYPETSIFITPEIFNSDITTIHLPLKRALSEALSQQSLPLWEKNIAMGFPVLAETEVGAFFIPNLVLFSLFSSTLAFNLIYPLSFIATGVGVYILAKLLSLKPLSAFFSAFVFVFSGFFMGHIHHPNLLEAVALLPWLFIAALLYTQSRNVGLLMVFALLLSQQVFAGHVQIVFISLLAMYVFLIMTCRNKKDAVAIYTKISIAVGVGLLISAAQILPLYELGNLSWRAGGLPQWLVLLHSFPPNHLATTINPFIFGSPQNASYVQENIINGVNFWESNVYIGPLSLLLVLYSLYVWRRSKKMYIIAGGTIFFVLLAFGRFGPFGFVYSAPIFNVFRAPIRFVLPALLIAALAAGKALDKLPRMFKKQPSTFKKTFTLGIVTITCIHTLTLWQGFHPTYPAQEWFNKPEAAQIVTNNINHPRIFNINEKRKQAAMAKAFDGWNHDLIVYKQLQNGLPQNMNSYWDIQSLFMSTGGNAFINKTYELEILFQSVADSYFSGKNSNTGRIMNKLLDTYSITHVVANTNLKLEGFELIKETQDAFPYHIYENTNYPPRARMVYTYKTYTGLQEFSQHILSEGYEPNNNVLLGSEIHRVFDQPKSTYVKIHDVSDTEVKIDVETETEGLLVLADTFYPGWKAYIDSKSTDIIEANYVNRAVVVPPGKHTVRFVFEPTLYKQGFITSIAGYALAIFALIVFRNKKW